MPKLIILRGNSGSGKSTVALRLREACRERVALVEQDYVRRIVMREKEAADADNIELIGRMVEFALERGYHVILEGILRFSRYGRLLERLRASGAETHVYYFDIPFEETLRRHATKSCAHEFGEKEMRDWYAPNDMTSFPEEKIIPATSTSEDTVRLILEETGLVAVPMPQP